MTALFYQSNAQPPKYAAPVGYWIPASGIVSILNSSSSYPTVDTLTLLPVIITEPMSLSEMAVYIPTGGAGTGAACVLALYFNDPSTNQAGALLGQTASLALTSSGAISGSFGSTVNVAPGIYWMACSMKYAGVTTPASICRVSGLIFGTVPPYNSLNDLGNTPNRCYVYTPSVYSTIPTDFTGLLTSQSNLTAGVVPLTFVMRSA